jgi:hypothetical protein
VRIYARDYVTRLEGAGFVVSVFDWLTEPHIFGGPANTFSLAQGEQVYVAMKGHGGGAASH